MIWLALALAAAPSPVTTFQYYSPTGHDSCADWTQDRDPRGNRNQVLEGWVLGYVTAYNQYEDSTGGMKQGGNATALLGWLDQYCAANPLDSVVQASTKLVAELRRRSR